jgi:hypothetical protein
MAVLEAFDPPAATALARVDRLPQADYLVLLELEGVPGCSTRQE